MGEWLDEQSTTTYEDIGSIWPWIVVGIAVLILGDRRRYFGGTMTPTAAKETPNGTGAAAGAEPQAPSPTPWEQLRAPFPPERIGKLHRSTKRENPKGKCRECGTWGGLPAVHLDYVGHADVTDRLLAVDPFWNWEPLAFDENGQPRFVRNQAGAAVGLWIKLTVHAAQESPPHWNPERVTRLGYGTVEPGAFDAEKQLIGDALRNAAMRFGVGLDLWRKEFDAEAPAPQAAPVASESRPVPQDDAPQPSGATEAPTRVSLLADVMAMDGQARMTVLRDFGWRSNLPVNQWIAKLDDDVAAKLAHAIQGGGHDPQTIAVGGADDDIPF